MSLLRAAVRASLAWFMLTNVLALVVLFGALCAGLAIGGCGGSTSSGATVASHRDRFVRQARQVARDDQALVPMADFLDGNTDEGSIAPNLASHPGMAAFSRAFSAIGERDDVHSVSALVELEYDEYPDQEWPFASSVFVVTRASVEDVQAWLSELDPDPCEEVSAEDWPAGLTVPEGYRVVLVWWD